MKMAEKCSVDELNTLSEGIEYLSQCIADFLDARNNSKDVVLETLRLTVFMLEWKTQLAQIVEKLKRMQQVASTPVMRYRIINGKLISYKVDVVGL